MLPFQHPSNRLQRQQQPVWLMQRADAAGASETQVAAGASHHVAEGAACQTASVGVRAGPKQTMQTFWKPEWGAEASRCLLRDAFSWCHSASVLTFCFSPRPLSAKPSSAL